MAIKKMFSNISPKSLVISLLVGAIATLGGVHYLRNGKIMKESEVQAISYSGLKSPKLKKFFNKVQKDPKNRSLYFEEMGPLNQVEIDQGYLAAVESFQYDLAIDFYNLGAKDCFRPGEDILLIAIHTGQLGLVDDLLTQDYPIKLYHLNAARSLVNIDQHTWAFIYKMPDNDDLGFQKYLIRSQKLASNLISIYKSQNPVEQMRYEVKPVYQENYQMLFGTHAQADFEQELKKTLQGDYTFETAFHGTQKTPILVNEEGKKIGIVKTKNEILAQAIDHDHFASVPPAAKAQIDKFGEVVVQKWVSNSKMATEYQRSSDLNLEQLHHIRVLDIRLGNSDRNRGNVLIADAMEEKMIIPIDHDLLMHYIPNDNNWEASYLNAPFSPISKKYIETLDLERDAQIMADLNYTQDDIKSMKIRTTLLKMASEKNLTLKETDMLFRFYYYDFLEHAEKLTASSTETEYRDAFNPHMQEVSVIIQNPVQVWGLIGNNFELYI